MQKSGRSHGRAISQHVVIIFGAVCVVAPFRQPSLERVGFRSLCVDAGTEAFKTAAFAFACHFRGVFESIDAQILIFLRRQHDLSTCNPQVRAVFVRLEHQ